jgi:DNA primase large subunit
MCCPWRVLETDVGTVVLSEIEACSFRNKSPEETAEYMKSILDKYMPLRSGTSKSQNLQDERKKDHYSHFILRLAFSSTEDLRRRFARLETMLFRLRFKADDVRERQDFVRSLDLEWEEVKDDEKREFRDELLAAAGTLKKSDDQEWFKVDWERVPELIEQRRVFLKRGKAYVPQREQMSLVVAEFTKKLDEALEVRQFHRIERILLTHRKADLPRPAPPRRGRSSGPYPRAPLAIVHRT